MGLLAVVVDGVFELFPSDDGVVEWVDGETLVQACLVEIKVGAKDLGEDLFYIVLNAAVFIYDLSSWQVKFTLGHVMGVYYNPNRVIFQIIIAWDLKMVLV